MTATGSTARARVDAGAAVHQGAGVAAPVQNSVAGFRY
jgi:hypothetical protein